MPQTYIIKADIRDRLKVARIEQYLLDLKTWGQDVLAQTNSIAWGLGQDQYPFSLEQEQEWLEALIAECPTPERRYISRAQGNLRPRPLEQVVRAERAVQARQRYGETGGRNKPRRPRRPSA